MQVGIDVGATKIESVVLEENGNETHRSRTECPKDYFTIIQTIKDIYFKLENEFKKELQIGVCHPGIHSPQTGLVKNAPNCNWLEKKPFQADLRKALGREVFCENDANCFALSEAVDGAGKGHPIVFGVIIGTGTGGGISVNQKVLAGRNNIAGEWGHVGLPNRSDDEKKYAKQCYCGKSGCMETYVSGPGFASCFNLKHNTTYDSHAILEEFNNNEKRAIQALDNYVDHLARGLSLVCNILDPDIIVLGGGMSNISYIYDHINTSLKKYIFSDTFNTKVVKNVHGDSGGVRGAAWLS